MEVKNPKRVVATDLEGAQNIPEGATKVYANHVGLSLSPMDLRLAFSEMVGFEGDKLLVEPMVFVTLPLPTAKALLHMLESNIARFEKRFGSINITPIMDDDLKGQKAEDK